MKLGGLFAVILMLAGGGEVSVPTPDSFFPGFWMISFVSGTVILVGTFVLRYRSSLEHSADERYDREKKLREDADARADKLQARVEILEGRLDDRARDLFKAMDTIRRLQTALVECEGRPLGELPGDVGSPASEGDPDGDSESEVDE